MRRNFTHRPLFKDRAGFVLDQMKRQQKGWASHLDDARVFAVFLDTLGEQMRKHCKPTRLDRGELTVAVDSATWRQQMAFLVDDLRKRVNAALSGPIVTSIRLVHGRPMADDQPAYVKPLPPDRLLTDEDRKKAAAIHDSCSNGELGEILAKAYLHQRRTDRDKP